MAAVVKRYALAAGLDQQEFSGHSLRAGFVTSAAETGATIFKIAEVSRHKSTDVLSGYVRRVDMFKRSRGGGVPVIRSKKTAAYVAGLAHTGEYAVWLQNPSGSMPLPSASFSRSAPHFHEPWAGQIECPDETSIDPLHTDHAPVSLCAGCGLP